MTELPGARVLVTGGTSGLGRAMAEAFVAAGATVALTSRDAARAATAARELGAALGVGFDTSVEAEVERGIGEVLAALGGIDVLVNNAGLGVRHINEGYLATPEPFWRIDAGLFRELVEVNVDGFFLVTKAVVPGMLAAGHGRIINVSINEATMQRGGFIPYGPSRAFTDAMTRAMAAELEGTGVTVNLLAPGGPAATRMITADASPGFRAKLIAPEVMGPPAVWLASDEAAAVTGRKLVAVDFIAGERPGAASKTG